VCRWRHSTGSGVFSILFVLYVLQVGSLIVWFTDTGQSLSAEVGICVILSYIADAVQLQIDLKQLLDVK